MNDSILETLSSELTRLLGQVETIRDSVADALSGGHLDQRVVLMLQLIDYDIKTMDQRSSETTSHVIALKSPNAELEKLRGEHAQLIESHAAELQAGNLGGHVSRS